jgi:signal peptidase I
MSELSPHDETSVGPVEATPPVRRNRRTSRSATRNAVEWVAVIVGAVLIALIIKGAVVQAFRIPSDSMIPTLAQGDRVLVNKLSYDAHDINRGDVVVFNRPDALVASPGDPEDLIKRVVGLPGETVDSRRGVVYVDGRKLHEPYLEMGISTYNLETPVVVPDDHVLVLGDNRGNSTDGRSFGPIPVDSVVGRAFTIMWPPGRIGAL